MALSNLSNDINKLNKQIQEIAKELNKTNFKLFNPGEVNEAQAALKGLREELREFNSELSYIAGAFRDALNELSKQGVALTDSKRALKSISNIAIELTTAESERTACRLSRQMTLRRTKARWTLQSAAEPETAGTH